MSHPVQACIAEGQWDSFIYHLRKNSFIEYTRPSKAAYVLPQLNIYEPKTLEGTVGMRLKFVNFKVRVAAAPVVEQKVADGSVVKSN